MSRSNNTERVSPCQRYFTWDSDNKCIRYYDKEQEKNVLVKLPFSFMVLDRLHAISGYSESEKGGIWSNEVRDIKKHAFEVKTKGGVISNGLYATIKDRVKSLGGKYAQSIYICFKEGQEYKIGNIKLVGAASSELIEWSKKKKIYEGAIQIHGAEDREKGRTKYSVPIFRQVDISDDAENVAKDIDKELQSYLASYLNNDTSMAESKRTDSPPDSNEPYGTTYNEPTEPSHTPEPMPDDPHQDLPF